MEVKSFSDYSLMSAEESARELAGKPQNIMALPKQMDGLRPITLSLQSKLSPQGLFLQEIPRDSLSMSVFKVQDLRLRSWGYSLGCRVYVNVDLMGRVVVLQENLASLRI